MTGVGETPWLLPVNGLDDGSAEVRRILEDRYAPRSRSAPSLRLYYAAKPYIPRWLQLAVRRAYARHLRKATGSFPAWPIEPVLVERLHDQLRARLADSGAPSLPFINFWPEAHRFAVVLTHDVEGPQGCRNIARLREIERRHGLVSSWYFPAEAYPFDDNVLAELRAEGCEIGLHAITHDGSMFEDRRSFDEHLPRIRAYFSEWGAEGFRSPATYRNADWMPDLGCLYDSSFPDTDPFEPQPGGCCSILPYYLGELVELPITMPQDHTLFEILGERSIAVWLEKADWVIRYHGLVNVLVHPDYALTEERLALYDQLLGHLVGRGGWHALPRDVARWWRTRTALEAAVSRGDADAVAAVGRAGATLAFARERDGEIVFEMEPQHTTDVER